MALDDFDCKRIDFDRQLCHDMSDTRLMSLYLLGEICVVALRDGKEYCEAMVKRVQSTVWCYDDIEENPPLAMDQFDDIINSQRWEKAKDLATRIFVGKLGLESLPMNESKRNIIGARFAWLCGDPKELANRYMPAKIGHPIYRISWRCGLLRKRQPHCNPPSSSVQQDASAERSSSSDRRKSDQDKHPSSRELTNSKEDTTSHHQYARPKR